MKLPEPRVKGELSLEETVVRRRSKRHFVSRELTWEHISQLLWAAQGVTEKRHELRAVPSAGAVYPLEVYIVIGEGVYRYIPVGHEVEQTLKGDVRARLCQAALEQEYIEEAPLSIVIAAVYRSMEGRYKQRSERYVHIEVGHAAQNVHLQAVALGLDSVPIGAFYDDQVKRILSLPQDCHPLYIIPIGYAGV